MAIFILPGFVFCMGVFQNTDDAESSGTYRKIYGKPSCLSFIIENFYFQKEKIFLKNISYINAEFMKNKVRPVDGVLGTGFLERHGAIIDYPHSRMYLKTRADGADQVYH